jgi:predicted ATPase
MELHLTLPVIEPDVSTLLGLRTNSHYTSLSGANNCGKSYVLKNVKLALGVEAYMVGTNRFYHLPELTTQRKDPNEYSSWNNQFVSQVNNPQYNYEQNYMELSKILSNMNDATRNRLFELCGSLIGSQFSLKKFEPDNELSVRYVDMDGQNVSLGSTGTRLLMTMLGLCMDDKFKIVLLDEPELGLGPKLQTSLASFLMNKEERGKWFPHLKHIWVATHSHLFLDKSDIRNNYVLTKNHNNIGINEITNFAMLNNLQFNLLGNTLESLFLPTAFVIVEGETDATYLEAWLTRCHPLRKILVIQASGDPKKKAHALREVLGDIFKSPFRSRIFVVLDSVHNRGLPPELESMGVPKENIVIWDNNGIEYVYPPEVVAPIFGCGIDDVRSIRISGDELVINEVSRKKNELCKEVVKGMDAQTKPPAELHQKFLAKISAAID